VQVVHDRDRAAGRLADGVFPGFPINKDVGHIASTFERDHAIEVGNFKLGYFPFEVMSRSKLFGNRKLVNLVGQLGGWERAFLVADHNLVRTEPSGMIQGKSRGGEKEKRREADHRQVGMKPAG